MEKKQIAVGKPVAVSGLTIVPVTETATYYWLKDGSYSFFGLKKPLYILSSVPGKPLEVFEINGEQTNIDKIISVYPELKDELCKFQK